MIKKRNLNFRQIHLDFHTSEALKGIGKDFDAEEFAGTLDQARVNSITCFARGHHGWLYYGSKEFPERIHPNLENKNLLVEQIEACHQKGIRVPIYITVQWDHFTAQQHPEWLVIDAEGNPSGTPIYEAGFYRFLCVNSPYRDFLKEQTKEVLTTIPVVDGIFFDIVQVKDCSCKYCRAGMEEMGLDPTIKENRLEYAQKVINDFEKEMTEFVHQYIADSTVFYNSGHVGVAHRESKEAYTHFELESLPSGGWGYMHFPIAVRYARNLGLDCMGMTGKFHTTWGDFHSFKNKEALEFECFQMLAMNAKCSIGDQLEPSGKISKPVYDLIGSVYSQVEQKEPWCNNAKAITELAVLSPEEFSAIDGERLSAEIIGVTRMLQESGYQFDIIDSKNKFADYSVLILPDSIAVEGDLANKLKQYLNDGGKVIASFESGLNKSGQFSLEEFGVRVSSEQTLDEQGNPVRGRTFTRNAYLEYILPKKGMVQGLPETEHAMYMKGLEVQADKDSEVLADTISSYFNRSYKYFCSHNQAPSSGEKDYPAIVKKDNLIYFAHPIFKQYHENAPRWCKQLLVNVLNILMPEKLVEHDGPTTMIVTLNEQEQQKRQILHLLHYVPERRSKDIDIIEDIIPLYNVKLSIKTDRSIKNVRLVPKGEEISFEKNQGRMEFVVPKVYGHQMVELDYS